MTIAILTKPISIAPYDDAPDAKFSWAVGTTIDIKEVLEDGSVFAILGETDQGDTYQHAVNILLDEYRVLKVH